MPVKGFTVCLLYGFREDFFKQSDIIGTKIRSFFLEIAPVIPGRFNFVVAAP